MDIIQELKNNRSITVEAGRNNYLKIVHRPEFRQVVVTWDFGEVDEVFNYKESLQDVHKHVLEYVEKKQKEGYVLYA